MGRPIAFADMNTILRPPPGEEANVVPLPVKRDPAEGTLVSCWTLTDAEVEEIVRTRRVWCSIWGGLTQPPVLVTGHAGEVGCGAQP